MALILVVAAVMALSGVVEGVLSDTYRYKWPYRWTTSAAITTLPFQEEHGCYGIPATNPISPYECVAAYDLFIGGGSVVSAHQGTVLVANNEVNTCRSDGGLGTQVWIDT